jgi:non-specific serine/threonine protein kinase
MADPTPADRGRIHPVEPVPFPEREQRQARLPVPLTSFVGRDREVAAGVDLLRRPEVRLVTLTGPGGVGKTRLALRVAEEVGGDPSTSSELAPSTGSGQALSNAKGQAFADGVVFVPLGAVADAALVVPAIAHALGIRETGERPLVDRLTDALRDRHLLVVLDNVEHVADAAPHVVALLTGCPKLKVLATGRAPLRRSGEHVMAIPPLALPRAGDPASVTDVGAVESVRLFVARARAARHDFVLTDGNAADVAALVERLDGLPLAIELAAARIAHLTPAALVARLERRLPLLTGGTPDLPERQRTMAATIAWSHDLLTTDEQVLFRRLAVFVGGFTLEAAEAVCGSSELRASSFELEPSVAGGVADTDRSKLQARSSKLDALDGIASLVDKSLVQSAEGTDGLPRYAMLETVREFGLDRLAASGEEQDVRRGHAAWCVALAERADPGIWGGPDHRRWLDLLQVDLANFRAALAWLAETGDGTGLLRLAAALGGLWVYRSYRAEGRAWLTRALAAGGDAPLARATALIKLVALDPSIERTRAVELRAEAVVLRREHGDRFGLGRALNGLGALLRDGAEDGQWMTLLEEAAGLMGSVGDFTGLAFGCQIRAAAALERGDADGARALLAEALTLFERDGFECGIADTLLQLGGIDADRGEVAAAAGRYAESLRLWQAVGNQEGLIDAAAATARLAASWGRPDAAPVLLGAAAAQGEALGYRASASEAALDVQAVSTARAAIGGEVFATSWATGRALSPEEVTAHASAVLASLAASASQGDAELAADGVGLTPREREVLVLVAEGLSDREVAAALFVGPGTVRSHLTSAYGKLGVGSRTAAVAAARRLGIL